MLYWRLTILKRIAPPAILSLATLSPALANVDLVPWGGPGPWKIPRDPNHGNGGLVETALRDGSYLRIGFDTKGAGTGDISGFNSAWVDIKEDEEDDIAYGDQNFLGQDRGTKLADMPGIIAKAKNIDLAVSGGAGIDIALDGSEDAPKQVLACRAE